MGRELLFDRFTQQALQTLHRYRAVMFSPPYPPTTPDTLKGEGNTPDCESILIN